MKVLYRRLFFLFSALLLVPLASCIKEEKANVECDIENIVVAQEDLITYTKIDRNRAIVSMKRKSDDFAEEINPTYVVSEGATYVIEDKNDRDAVHIEHVKVTSEDQQYSKTYTVIYTPTEIPENFGFEYWALEGKYEKCYEHGMTISNDDGTTEHYPDIDLYLWDSGNLGFSAVASGKGAKEYPTFSTDNAHSGSKAARLVTRKTGSLGATLGKPIAAGNIFLGEFSGKGINLMSEPLKATRFGYPCDRIPTSFELYFKYKPGTYAHTGDVFETREGTPDFCAIYAVFFDNVKAKAENPLNIPTLDGSNVFTSSSIIAIANLHTCDNAEYRQWEQGTNGEWKFINIPFKGVDENVDYLTLVDPERLKKQEYSLTIVCCSSYYGDFFEGAIDSELTIDDLTIHYKN